MKVLFLGSVIRTEDCIKYKGPSVAGNKMQIGLIKGLSNLFVGNLTVFTQVPIGAFPKEKKILMSRGKINLVNSIYAFKIPFVNIFIIKQLFLIINTLIMIASWSLTNNNEDKVIISFNAFPYISIPTLLAGKLFKLKTVCVFADPPIDVVKRGLLGNLAKLIEDRVTKKNIQKFDGLIVLNEKSIEKYAPNSRYILVDGGFDLADTPTNELGGQWLTAQKGELVTGVFSGALTEYNGIENLVEAMKFVKSRNFKVEFYGAGPLEEYVKEASKQDNRIILMGNVPNDEMIKRQQAAGVLINPRLVSEPVSMYTFPSKMIEYLLSGTPVATTKLNGLTNEYLENSFVFRDDTAKEMAKTIDYILQQDKKDLIKKAKMARNFIVENKNWDVHSKKIKDFIDYV